MLFPTLDFAVFFILVFAMSWMMRRTQLPRKIMLTVASYFFFAYWNWPLAFLLFAVTVWNYLASRWIDATKTPSGRKAVVALAVAVNLAVLGFFKYAAFFTTTVNNLSLFLRLPALFPIIQVILPLGISFYTFQAMSYTIDVYRRDIPASRSLLDVLLFISFFPQLVAGPIVRGKDFIPQLATPPNPAAIPSARALLLIAGGLFKKGIIANYLAVWIVDPVFALPQNFSTLEVILAVYGYAIQIYCDFSAYSDIAIGTAALLGYHFPDNFNHPYRSESIREFWRRWHISLSTWLRDYLYIPLGGNRKGKLRTYVNLAVTMLLGGLWHGAAWQFVLWGAIHGVGLAIERLFLDRRKAKNLAEKNPTPLARVVKVILTFNFVCVTWVFFRSQDIACAMGYFAALGNVATPSTLIKPMLLLFLAIGLGMHFIPEKVRIATRSIFSRWHPALQGVSLGAVLIVLGALWPDGIAPFIYFQF